MDIREIKERMHMGKLYYCNGEELFAEQAERLEKLYDFRKKGRPFCGRCLPK
mgnify:CR=1 FL=1